MARVPLNRRSRTLLSLAIASALLPTISAPSASASPVYSFTNAGATGSTGPTQAQVTSAYSGTSLAGFVTINTRGIQEWTVPASGDYSFEVVGAHGAASTTASNTRGGRSVKISAKKNLTAGTVIYIGIGQAGSADGSHGGGGGASFVAVGNRTATTNLLVAGGGGGTRTGATSNGGDANTETAGLSSGSSYNLGNATPNVANTSASNFVSSGDTPRRGTTSNAYTDVGYGGIGAGSCYGDGGAGWLGDGHDDSRVGSRAVSLSTTATGGTASNNGSNGGFGGGGAGEGCNGGGGGGGYTGGNGGFIAGGGGSYDSGFTEVSKSVDTGRSYARNGTPVHGYVTITSLGPAISNFSPTTTLTNSTTLTYNLTLTQSITASSLTSSDFSKTGTGSSSCTIGAPSGSGATYQVQLTGCSPGTVTLTLAQNSVTNSSSQTGPATATSAATVTIDQTAPTISSVSAPTSSTYIPSSTINFAVNFSESVTVTGSPRLPLTVGITQRYATFATLTDSKTAIFSYIVQNSTSDVDRDGVALTSPAELNGGSIADLAGNAMSSLAFTSPSLTGVKVAQLPGAPVITSIDPSNQTLTVNFTSPTDGGTDITNYQYSSNGGSTFSSLSPVDTTTPLILSGLTNGTAYNVGIRGLTTINGVETFGATSNFIQETPTVVEISAPSFTVSKGTLPGSFKVNFSPVTGAASYTVKVYKSNDSFASPFATVTNYTPGSDIQDGDPRISCTASTPICFGIRVGHTFRFTVTPVASSGYTSSGESAQSGKHAMFFPYGAGVTAPRDGVVGLDIIDAYSNQNTGKSGIIAYIYRSSDNYASVFETASIVGTSWNRVALPSGESYTVSFKTLGATVGDVVWLDSDESNKTSPGIFVWNKPNAPSNIVATRAGSESIRISWTHADGPYRTYYYHVSTNGTSWGTSRGNTTSDSATITGLTNGTTYYVRVYNFGSGTYERASDYVIMSGTITPAGTPGPVATGGSAAGDGSVSLVWTAPTDNGGSTITGYLIEYSANVDSYTESITALSTDTRITLTGLVNGTSYYVRIKAVNEVGAGTAVVFGGGSAILVQGTAGSIVGAVTSITGTTATISATINARGNTTTPTLRWGLVDGTQTDVTLAAVTTDNVVVTSNLTGLLPGRRYQVTSTTSPGISQDFGGRPVYFTTTPNAISSASSVTSTSSITVSWAYDAGGNGYGFNYDVTATLNGVSVGAGCQDVTAASGGLHSCEFTGLTANSTYVISITKTITGGDYGNGTSSPYTLTVSTDPNIATITLSINGGNLNLQRGSTINIVAATNVAGRVTFRLNGRAIKSCKSKSTVSLSVTCAWRPSVHGTATISALFNPTSNLYTNVTSAQSRVSVIRRTGSRS